MRYVDNGLDHEILADRYQTFMNQFSVQSFLANGGKVHIATDGRRSSTVERLYREGHRHFSEKFVQEVATKWCGKNYPEAFLHCYGHLQKNKTRRACYYFSMIESVDRDSLVCRLHHLKNEGLLIPPLLIQVNTGAEPQKGGYMRSEADRAVENIREFGLPVIGVMAIPPKGQNPREHFQWLRNFADRNSLSECHMGMSDDYEIAIDEGATSIRIGRIIFGEKN